MTARHTDPQWSPEVEHALTLYKRRKREALQIEDARWHLERLMLNMDLGQVSRLLHVALEMEIEKAIEVPVRIHTASSRP